MRVHRAVYVGTAGSAVEEERTRRPAIHIDGARTIVLLAAVYGVCK
jgi:hypothetical protein